MTIKKNTNPPPYRLVENDRFWVLCFSALLAVIVFVWVWVLIPAGQLRVIRLQQSFGLIALIYLYSAIITTPLLKVFPKLKIKNRLFHSRRAIGVGAFLFSLAHVTIAFIDQLGGFKNLAFLSGRYLIALVVGVVGLLILLVLAVTSFDKIIDWMGFPRWKRLHRLVYIASIAILVHIVMLGTHYAYGATSIGSVTFVALFIILILEAIRIDRVLKERFKPLRHNGLTTMIILNSVFLGVGFLIGKQGAQLPTFTVNSAHDDASSHNETYRTFDPVAKVNGQTITISENQVSRKLVIDGVGTIQFKASPNFERDALSNCFMVNQQNFTFVQGTTKNYPDRIDCSPIGDVNPPQVGSYTLYLRTKTGAVTSTTPFSMEITP